MTTENGEHDDAMEELKNDVGTEERGQEDIPPTTPQQESDDSVGDIARNDSHHVNERQEVSLPKPEGDYPWRDLSAQVEEQVSAVKYFVKLVLHDQ